MKKWIVPALILIGLPAIFYASLYLVKPKKELPYLGPQQTDTIIRPDGTYEIVSRPYQVPNFCLLTEDSTRLCWNDLKGKVKVVDFFFTRCPGICPVLSKNMRRIQDVYANEDRLVLVSISVDPEFDKPSVLKRYAQRYGYIPGKWIFLTGHPDTIKNVSLKGFFLPLQMGEPQELTHSEKMVLVDEENHIRGYYVGIDKKEVDRLITDLRLLLQSSND